MDSRLSIFLFLLALSSLTFGGETEFECTVTLVHAVSQQGEMVTDTDHLLSQRGSKFSVDRASGKVTGSNFLDSENSETVTVINEPTANSYYAIYESYGPIKMIGYLYIANHRTWPTKPFTYTTAGEYVYSGFCE